MSKHTQTILITIGATLAVLAVINRVPASVPVVPTVAGYLKMVTN